MTIRIHFGAADVAKTRFSAGPDPLWEVLLSLHLLQTDDEPEVFGMWRRRARRVLDDGDRAALALAPPDGYSPDFLTPAEAEGGLGAGLRAIATMPAQRVRGDLDQLAGDTKVPNWAWKLASDTSRLRQLAGVLGRYHERLLVPHWPAIRTQVELDLAIRSKSFLTRGFGAIVPDIHRTLRWQAPVLEVQVPNFTADVHLDGRGLRLVPSMFCVRHPIMLRDADLRPVLVYPVRPDPSWFHAEPAIRGQITLAALLGRTRAKVLVEVTAERGSTSDVARRVGISVASASEHAAVLSRSGLITSRRSGKAVIHSTTLTGHSLVRHAGLT